MTLFLCMVTHLSFLEGEGGINTALMFFIKDTNH